MTFLEKTNLMDKYSAWPEKYSLNPEISFYSNLYRIPPPACLAALPKKKTEDRRSLKK